MKSMIALIQREYLEHRGAFLYAPAVILVLFALAMVSAIGFDRVGPRGFEMNLNVLKFFEIAYLFTSALWFLYLLVTLFFYFADAFSADRRNNAMLFWKSMPVSDFKVLGSKMLAGATIFPALILVAIMIGMLIATGIATIAAFKLPASVLPDYGAVLASAVQVLLFDLVFMMLGLLWYAPFFAWVGMLSTVVGRWSIPVAFLIPGVISLFENIVVDLHFLAFIKERLQFVEHDGAFEAHFLTRGPFDATAEIAGLLAGIDWTQMVGGLAVAVLFVWLASEYRRRYIIT